ncbi:MAG: hypothetical protein V9G20_16360 [Candidatus Promineifilaceae bacterium]
MKIDFHFHAALSKKIGFELDFFRTTLQQARQVGLDALAVTEHFNSSNIDVLYPTLDAEFEYVGDYYLADGIKLFPGLEIDVQEGPHILVLGNRAAIEVLRGRLQPHLTPDTFCSMAERCLPNRLGWTASPSVLTRSAPTGTFTTLPRSYGPASTP